MRVRRRLRRRARLQFSSFLCSFPHYEKAL